MNAKLEERIEYAKRALPAMLFLGMLGLGFYKACSEAIMQPKRQQIRMAACKQALDNHVYNHLIRMGDEVNGEVIDTISETAELMPLYADINGKKIAVPLNIKIKYLAEHNGIPTSGKDGYAVKEGQILKF